MPPALENPVVLWLLLTAILAGLAYAFMRPELRTRAVLYGGFLLACGVAMWPPFTVGEEQGKIKLGLDLRGGMHLVMQVTVDDALNAIISDGVQTVRDQLAHKGVGFTSAERIDTTSFSVDGVEPARVKDARDVIKDYLREGWEVREGAEGRFIVQLTTPYQAQIRERTVKESIKTLERRVNQLGVAEPVIAAYGNRGDQILVQLPGVTDPDAAKRVMKKTASLSLKLVEGEPASSREALLQATGGKVPDNLEVVNGQGDQAGVPLFYLVRREAVITGRDLKSARTSVDPQTNAPAVSFILNALGAEKFKRETGRNIGRRLAIILDDSVASAPTIHAQISDQGQITGRFTTAEADELSKVLSAGALPATLKYLQELTVGPSLGKDSIRAGVLASAAGMAFLTLFMLVYYRLSGLNAVVALVANLVILLGAMAYFGATLTLPGIAGIILTIGVGVDTNVLIFERIREELRNGKTVRAAISNGFDRVWITIIDTHATALLAAAVLFAFGTGAIKGFAVTLVWGLVANIFASYFVSKFLFEWVLGKRQVDTLSI
ncbi:MAG TPA: protein translocase subunit SecD [Vicinamibacteria bacterium]|nr:protein translocase subunit SecD [Vicinamibacteria bacterium]